MESKLEMSPPTKDKDLGMTSIYAFSDDFCCDSKPNNNEMDFNTSLNLMKKFDLEANFSKDSSNSHSRSASVNGDDVMKSMVKVGTNDTGDSNGLGDESIVFYIDSERIPKQVKNPLTSFDRYFDVSLSTPKKPSSPNVSIV